jgi:hypothetical protein
LNIGESTVFTMVWPVLKSLPPMGTPLLRASCSIAGKSQVRFGAPLANGTPSISAAQAYSIDGAIEGSLASIARSNASRVQWAGPGLMKISVEAHHTITSRLQPCRLLKSRMSWRRASASSRLVRPALTFFPSSRFTYCWSNTAGVGLIPLRKSAIGSMCSCRSSTPAFTAAV